MATTEVRGQRVRYPTGSAIWRLRRILRPFLAKRLLSNVTTNVVTQNEHQNSRRILFPFVSDHTSPQTRKIARFHIDCTFQYLFA